MPATLSESREKLFETIDAANHERANKGHFTKGNRGGPGNPFARQVGQLRSAMLASVQPEDLQHIIRVLIALAVAGDLAAARLVLQYTLGKPAAATDPDRADIDEAKMHLEGSTKPGDVEAMLRSMPPNFVNVMAEEVRPIVLQKNFEEAERISAEQAEDRARRDAEMTAEEDAWEAEQEAAACGAGVSPAGRHQTVAESTHLAPRDVGSSHDKTTSSVGPRQHLAERDEYSRSPSPNGPAPSTNGTLEELLRAWARDGGLAPLPKGPLG